ncbi:hypothetical protein HPP92_013426 [Vanilla planifolia]|uniref:Plant bHLH transcription factor ACT-like domain-containing protein n=1 Tax=Vanilla planifolia TaxID=51239 RepID=A0A835R073_VANPL|nr:hypothetical protein HPP92_013853 [Vanilla planifolia]KAG0478707.1 hypothetical protein HPP92_013426 [Vanilla planifolia]
MVSREQRAALHEKLHLLRSVTHSRALNKKSIIADASKYIEGLKQKVELLNREIAYARNPLTPRVTVDTLEKGFLIKVFSPKSFPGLLVSVLEVFEELGLNVLEASVSCTETFRLEAVGEEGVMETLDAEVVKQAIKEAIKDNTENSSETSEQEEV